MDDEYEEILELVCVDKTHKDIREIAYIVDLKKYFATDRETGNVDYKVLYKYLFIKLYEKCVDYNEMEHSMEHICNDSQYNDMLLKQFEPLRENYAKTVLKDEICSICHDNYSTDTDFTLTNCKHHFHEQCLKKYVKNRSESSIKRTCPLCRTDFSGDIIRFCHR